MGRTTQRASFRHSCFRVYGPCRRESTGLILGPAFEEGWLVSDISIPGVSSKYNTSKLIEDLVAAERIRLTRMEENVSELEETRSTWRQVNMDLGDLQRSVKSLYGFDNPFSEKSAVSSNERILTASAGRTAPFDEYSITVKQIATADRFITPSLDRSFRMEGGTYTFRIGEDSISLRYRGGTLEDFAARLNAKGEGLIKATTVRDTSETLVLMIEAVPTGAANRLIFEDDAKDFGIRTGMMRPARTAEGSVALEDVAASPQTVSGTPAPKGSIELSGEGMVVRPGASVNLPFNPRMELEEGMILEYSFRTIEYKDDELSPPAPPGPLWPDVPSGSYRGLEVASSPNSFPIPEGEKWVPPERKDDWNVLTANGPEGAAELPPIQASESFKTVRVNAESLPGGVDSLALENGNTHRAVEIKGIRLYNPNKQGDLEPVSPIDTAGDAIIEFRGIQARRSTNDITDLVDGLTLHLKRASNEPVDLLIEPDTEAAKEGIIRFVFSYNRTITRVLVLTTDNEEVVDELSYLDDDEREKMHEQLGALRGDMTLNQLKSRLQGIVSNPYPTRAGSDLTLLAQIGVSTDASSGRSGGSIDHSKLRGYLEIDEEKLDDFLTNNIDAVKDLFGNDTTGDLVVDSGVARAVDEYLTPYTQTGGFVGMRLSRIDNQIDDTKDDIADYEEYLEDYEADLRRQYGNMEAMLNQLEHSSQELDNFNRQQSGNR